VDQRRGCFQIGHTVATRISINSVERVPHLTENAPGADICSPEANFLSGVFHHAAQQGYFDGANPVMLAEVPAFAPNGAETKPYSLEEIAGMLKVLSEPSATAVATAAFTGIRLGELRGLTWESFEPAQDEESLGWVNVTRTVWRTVGDPKTAKSKAPVPVIPQLAQRLDAHRKRCGNPAAARSSPTRSDTRST
jgi:integrase